MNVKFFGSIIKQMASDSAYTLPSAETEVTTLLEKVLHEGLNTTELAAVYDDLSQEYDKVMNNSCNK